MIRITLVLLFQFSFLQASAKDSLNNALSFETLSESTYLEEWKAGGWSSYPKQKVVFDSNRTIEGNKSAHLINDVVNNPSVVIWKDIPFDYISKELSLRAKVYSNEASKVNLGLVFIDSFGKSFSTEEQNELTISAGGWNTVEIKTKNRIGTRSLRVVIQSKQKGEIWIDNIELNSDGLEVCKLNRMNRGHELDHQFDSGSNINLKHVSEIQIDALERLGLVWGFLKYHHPNIRSGQFHWDYELFRVLPSILECASLQEIDDCLHNWVIGFQIEDNPHKHIQSKRNQIQLHANLSILNDETFFGAKLRGVLNEVYQARLIESPQYYMALNRKDNMPVMGNEIDYKDQSIPDTGYRLLALFRYWNLVQYWFPYRDLMDNEWGNILRQFVTNFITARTRDEYLFQFAALAAEIDDTHANALYWAYTARKGSFRFNAMVRYVEDEWIVYDHEFSDEPKELKIGDIITSIQGIPTKDYIKKYTQYCSASNEAVLMREAGMILSLWKEGECEIGIIRDKQQMMVRAKTYKLNSNPKLPWHNRNKKTADLLSEDIAYFDMSSVSYKEWDNYLQTIKKCKAIIIDLRNYPKDNRFGFYVAGHFIKERTDFAKLSSANSYNPGEFSFKSPNHAIFPQSPYLDKEVVILVDEVSQSNAEFQAMAFSCADKSYIVGSMTAGADGDVFFFPLPGGITTCFTSLGVYYPDGKQTQRIGIVPDVTVHPSIKGITQGRDEVLETAVKLLRGSE